MSLWTLSNTNTDLWLESFDSSTVTIDAGVSEWRDKKGNGIVATQATTAAQPSIAAADLNGLDVLDFNGSSHFLSCGDVLRLGTGSLNIFLVGKIDVPGALSAFYAKALSSAMAGRYSLYAYTDSNLYGLFTYDSSAGPTPYASFTSTDYALIHHEIDRTNGYHRIYINGVLFASSTFTPNSMNLDTNKRFLIGAYNDATDAGENSFLNGKMAILAAIKGAFDIDLKQKIEGSLLWQCGLEAKLPSGHPYESAAPTYEIELSSEFSQPFLLELGTTFSQKFGTAVELFRTFSQPFGQCREIFRTFSQKFGQAPEISQTFSQKFKARMGLSRTFSQPFSCLGTSLSATFSQPFFLHGKQILARTFSQPFRLLSSTGNTPENEPLLQSFTISIITDGVSINPDSISISSNQDRYYISLTITLPNIDDYQKCVIGADLVIDDGEEWNFIIDEKSEQDELGNNNYTIIAKSRRLSSTMNYSTKNF